MNKRNILYMMNLFSPERITETFKQVIAEVIGKAAINALAEKIVGSTSSKSLHPAGMENAMALFQHFNYDLHQTMNWFKERGCPIDGTPEERFAWHENNWEKIRGQLKIMGLFKDDDSDLSLSAARKK